MFFFFQEKISICFRFNGTAYVDVDVCILSSSFLSFHFDLFYFTTRLPFTLLSSFQMRIWMHAHFFLPLSFYFCYCFHLFGICLGFFYSSVLIQTFFYLLSYIIDSMTFDMLIIKKKCLDVLLIFLFSKYLFLLLQK